MLKLILLPLLFLSVSFLSAQTDEDLIRHTLHNYFQGTSHSYPDQITAAFHPETKLFLEQKNGEAAIFSVEEYVNLFRKREPGTLTGRYNQIMSIDKVGNLAHVKAEITVPVAGKIYTDFFILRRMEDDQWLIIGKAANSRVAD